MKFADFGFEKPLCAKDGGGAKGWRGVLGALWRLLSGISILLGFVLPGWLFRFIYGLLRASYGYLSLLVYLQAGFLLLKAFPGPATPNMSVVVAGRPNAIRRIAFSLSLSLIALGVAFCVS